MSDPTAESKAGIDQTADKAKGAVGRAVEGTRNGIKSTGNAIKKAGEKARCAGK